MSYLYLASPSGFRLVSDDDGAFLTFREFVTPAEFSPSYTIADYRSAMLAFLPTGLAWDNAKYGKLGDLVEGICVEFSRVSDRAEYLAFDALPSNTIELLPEWMKSVGLPLAGDYVEKTDDEWRSEVIGALTFDGVIRKDFLIEVAAKSGFNISIQTFKRPKIGSKIGDKLYCGDWPYYFRVTTSATPRSEQLETLISKYKPAHIGVIFTYIS